MLVTVVVAFSRPENWERVLENFARQRHREKHLVVVANGRARDTFAPELPGGSVVIGSGASPALARNAGLAWVREHGGGPVTFWDDDDYYGKNYLAEVAADITRGAVTVKFFRYVRWDDGLHYCLGAEPPYPTCGATLSGFADELPDWPDCKHEDMLYAPLLLAAGLQFRKLSPWGFIYDRRSNATRELAASKLAYLVARGPALNLGHAPDTIADVPSEPRGTSVAVPSMEEVLAEVRQFTS